MKKALFGQSGSWCLKIFFLWILQFLIVKYYNSKILLMNENLLLYMYRGIYKNKIKKKSK